jgi:tricorn protease-like protein
MAGRGRPKGSAGASFIGVHLGELNRVLKEDAIVMVSRGKAILTENNAKHLEAVTEVVEVKFTDLDEEESEQLITKEDF